MTMELMMMTTAMGLSMEVGGLVWVAGRTVAEAEADWSLSPNLSLSRNLQGA